MEIGSGIALGTLAVSFTAISITALLKMRSAGETKYVREDACLQNRKSDNVILAEVRNGCKAQFKRIDDHFDKLDLNIKEVNTNVLLLLSRRRNDNE